MLTAPVVQNNGNQATGGTDVNNTFPTYTSAPAMAWGGKLEQIIPFRQKLKDTAHQKEPLNEYFRAAGKGGVRHVIAFSCTSPSPLRDVP